jgi:membrane-associated protease RseP (regulator of RpoE activity)
VLLRELHYRYKVVDRISHPDPVLVALEGPRAILEVETLQSAGPVSGGSAGEAASPALADATGSGAGGPLPPDAALPGRAILDGDLLEKIQVQELGRGRYEVPAADVQAVLENAARVLADLEPFVWPTLSLDAGFQYRITSAAGDGVLSRQGFTVTAPKLAERAGLQVGDTILNVNGQPVDGFASLYRIFRQVRSDPALRTVQVELDRRGTRLTQTYRLR